MKKWIVAYSLLIGFAATAQGDSFLIGFGFGGAFSRQGLGHADLTMTYLRYNNHGGFLTLEANGRTFSGTRTNTLKSYSGLVVGYARNLIPYGDSGSKLIARAGVAFGSGLYIDSVIVENSALASDYMIREFRSPGLALSMEGMTTLRREDRAFGIQLFVVINRHPFVGGALRYNLGMF